MAGPRLSVEEIEELMAEAQILYEGFLNKMRSLDREPLAKANEKLLRCIEVQVTDHAAAERVEVFRERIAASNSVYNRAFVLYKKILATCNDIWQFDPPLEIGQV